ncbi:MAG: ACT domain-containing protein [Conexivisphaera sp.]
MSVADAVRRVLESNLPAKLAVMYGYANLSALARAMKPAVEEMSGGRVSDGAVLVALRRLRTRGTPDAPSDAVRRVIGRSSVSVRTDISRISVARTRGSIRVVMELLRRSHEHLVHLTEGLESVTIAVDSRASDVLSAVAGSAEVLERKDGLAALIISSPPEIKSTPGCLIPIFVKLYEEGINVEDMTSSHTDTVVLVDSRDAARAFSALDSLIKSFRLDGPGGRGSAGGPADPS